MKILGVISALLPTFVLGSLSAGEAQLRQVPQPNQLCSDQPDAAIVMFEDANLEAAVRAALGVSAQEDLTCGLISVLTVLDASSSGIESVVGIQNLRSPTGLGLAQNSITDISSLSRLTSLTNLLLDGNPALSNIQPLLDNTGLGAGDAVDLRLTSVSCTDVAALEAKGVAVTSDCP